jgi:hypothetical protein
LIKWKLNVNTHVSAYRNLDGRILENVHIELDCALLDNIVMNLMRLWKKIWSLKILSSTSYSECEEHLIKIKDECLVTILSLYNYTNIGDVWMNVCVFWYMCGNGLWYYLNKNILSSGHFVYQ